MNRAHWCVLVLVGTLGLGGVAVGQTSIDSQAASSASSQAAASSVADFAQREALLNAEMAPIRSRAELDAYLLRTRSAASPLSALSPSAQHRFLNSLRFTPAGLASFRYADLEAELTPTQAYKLLALFGVQQDVPLLKSAREVTALDAVIMGIGGGMAGIGLGDHEGYWCETSRPHTCAKAPGYICTGNC